MDTIGAKESERNIHTMNAGEIKQLFEWYGFKDEQGHMLIHCSDFIELVKRAVLTEGKVGKASSA